MVLRYTELLFYVLCSKFPALQQRKIIILVNSTADSILTVELQTKGLPVFGMDQTKTQGDAIPSPGGLPAGVIVSPDARRPNRIPPGQSRTKKWPVLDASGPPAIDLAAWQFRVGGLVGAEITWSQAEFAGLPQVRVFSDFHCVTRWSRLGNLWEGVSTRELIARSGGAKPEARYVTVYGYDRGWTTNLPLDRFLAEDALVAFLHDGEAISTEHGGPARLIVPQLYAWKSAKWVAGVELMAEDRPGFWEANGYHMRGDPWTQERYSL
jgi:DMSO/TMAO reductase YedYZ molybdopterin-dependent catalytic subunit